MYDGSVFICSVHSEIRESTDIVTCVRVLYNRPLNFIFRTFGRNFVANFSEFATKPVKYILRQRRIKNKCNEFIDSSQRK